MVSEATVGAVKGRALLEGNFGATQRQGFLAAMHVEGKKDKGRTETEIQLRYIATGAPLWVELQRAKNFNWFARHESAVTVTDTESGRLWAYRGEVKSEVLEMLEGSTNTVKRLAQRVLDKTVEALINRGETRDAIANTPVFKSCEELGLTLNYTKAPRKAKTSNGEKKTRVLKRKVAAD